LISVLVVVDIYVDRRSTKKKTRRRRSCYTWRVVGNAKMHGSTSARQHVHMYDVCARTSKYSERNKGLHRRSRTTTKGRRFVGTARRPVARRPDGNVRPRMLGFMLTNLLHWWINPADGHRFSLGTRRRIHRWDRRGSSYPWGVGYRKYINIYLK